MYGFERAMREYESKMTDPFANEDYEDEYEARQDYLERQADAMYEDMRLGEC